MGSAFNYKFPQSILHFPLRLQVFYAVDTNYKILIFRSARTNGICNGAHE